MNIRFQQHIERTFPYLRTSKFLVAVSGGLDSVVLVHLCKEAALDFSIVHCNFNLRGKESDEDEAFVKKLGTALKVEVYTKSFDTQLQVTNTNQSVQMVARSLRYQWFNELCLDYGFTYVLTAHHLDDSMETFFINLSRGTGIEGLTGIPERNKKVLRPLLPFSREELKNYAVKKKISWREDSSNQETKYLRNKIRHTLIPILKDLHPDFTQSFTNTQNFLKGTSTIVETHINTLKGSLFIHQDSVITVDTDALLALVPLDAYLYELFKEFQVTAWKDLKHLLKAQSGKQLLSATHRFVKDRDRLLITPLLKSSVNSEVYYWPKETSYINAPICLSFRETKNLGKTDALKINVDKEKLKFPLIVRKWKNGDYFYPTGMRGKKKLSKFFKDEKYALPDKEAQWLLCSEDAIVWVIGKRADRRFLPELTTTSILEIAYTV
ncbi:tRNA lysidine(34) synthetase TilS [Ascidiimonas sp. W6]|uniref:tRNA lysidine(34) synthetase TilS n=1 Tax=Ascidiimonas meishanensis TaxID=3128903 RepID=UPI0030EDC14D